MSQEQRYRDYRKIDPTRGDTLADGSPNNDDRIETMVPYWFLIRSTFAMPPTVPTCNSGIHTTRFERCCCVQTVTW